MHQNYLHCRIFWVLVLSEKDAEFSCYSATCLEHNFPVLVCYCQTIWTRQQKCLSDLDRGTFYTAFLLFPPPNFKKRERGKLRKRTVLMILTFLFWTISHQCGGMLPICFLKQKAVLVEGAGDNSELAYDEPCLLAWGWRFNWERLYHVSFLLERSLAWTIVCPEWV